MVIASGGLASASTGTSSPGASEGASLTTAAGQQPGEAIVAGRLLAPCCYIQTLDVHESPLASELRLEVRSRLGAGESPDAIEDDLVARYGERIRAIPKGKDPRRGMIYFAGGVLIACGVGLAALLRRWRSNLPAPQPVSSHGGVGRDALDDRIDEELGELEG